jgi:2,3-bisphosphoglycerate-independent phosphoglycerate mutase
VVIKGDKKSTKYIVLVGDGMADYPLSELGGKTPLEIAHTPNMDRIAACRTGLARTIPEGMAPGSDVANLSLLGYDPLVYHTGRGAFEAASMRIGLKPDDVAFRMNLVTLDRKRDDEILMISHSSGDITTVEAAEIIDTLKKVMVVPGVEIYPGVAYRHLLLWSHGPLEAEAIPPHDVLGRNMAAYLNHKGENPIPRLIRLSWEQLEGHPVNAERRKRGLKEANSIWLWGQGKAPKLPLFNEKFGLGGGVISAVDLIKGIGVYAGFKPIDVEGATGYLDTNYIGKAEEALKGLTDLDFVFLHVEAPDEASHNGLYEEKIKAIENFDEKVVGLLLQGLRRFEDYRVMVVSDHFTPIVKKTHTDEPTPFAWAGKREIESIHKGLGFTEKHAAESGLIFEKGHDLMPAFLAPG